MRVEMIRCDLCSFDIGPFTRVDFLDFCRWCADTRAVEWAESGGCRVTFDHAHNAWRCSCGASYRELMLFVPAYVAKRVPNAVIATANMHINRLPS